MKKITFILWISVMLTSLNSCFEAQAGSVEMVSPEEAAALLEAEEAIVVDVRSTQQFDNGHLINAINIPVESENLEELIASLDKNQPVMVYCNRGGQSAECAKILKEKGFKKIYDLEGGLSSWEASGRKVVLKTEE